MLEIKEKNRKFLKTKSQQRNRRKNNFRTKVCNNCHKKTLSG